MVAGPAEITVLLVKGTPKEHRKMSSENGGTGAVSGGRVAGRPGPNNSGPATLD